MTELQIGLLAIGALVVAAVFAYNRSLEREAARRGTPREFPGQADALLETRPVAPVGHAEERREPLGRRGQLDALPDARLDYVIEIDLGKAVAGAVLAQHMEGVARRFGSRALIALAGGDGVWHNMADSALHEARRVRAALQLVTRAGAVKEAQLIEFRAEMESVAAQLQAATTAPEMRGAIDAAGSLDRLCGEADIQIALHVNPGSGRGFAAADVELAARRAGLAAIDGGFEQCNAQGQLVYTLDDTGMGGEETGIAGLTLLLDVPRVQAPRRGFDAMVSTARQVAAALGGVLADENGGPLDDRAIAAIGAEIERVAAALEARGIEPGGVLAQRLFS